MRNKNYTENPKKSKDLDEFEDFEKLEGLKKLEDKIGYTFKNKSLLKKALTHPSFNEGDSDKALDNYERMEFLGDSILSFSVSEVLYTKLTDMGEGRLTRLRAALVCEDSLYRIAKEIGLGEFIFMGRGETLSKGGEKPSILSNVFEAVIAAIYLDNFDEGFVNAAKFVLRFLPGIDELRTLASDINFKNPNSVATDFKTLLQEKVQENPDSIISYELVDEKGAAHEKTFFVNVKIDGKIMGSGSGTSKKRAQQAAARAALFSVL